MKLPINKPNEFKDFTKVNEALTRVVKPDPRNTVAIEIGDSKKPEFVPRAQFTRWGEVSFALTRKKEWTNPSVKYNGSKVIFEDTDEEVHIYEKPEVGQEGALEIEIVLKSIPINNRFDFELESTDLNFFYQKKLTQDEIDRGATRPENVEDSYAVYHAKKVTNYEGGTIYGSGKAFHIYRPHIIDAAGNETWGKLEIDKEKGLLTVIVPPEFLSSAVYPVYVDPTIGYETAGASGWGYNYSLGTTGAIGAVFDLPGDVTDVTSISINGEQRTGHAAAPSCRHIIATTGNIISRLSDVGTIPSLDPTWITLNVATATTLVAGSYRWGMQVQDRGFSISYDSASGESLLFDADEEFTSIEGDPFTWSTEADSNRLYSIYMTYTTTDTAPTVTTNAASNVNSQTYTADLNGDITATNGTVFERGFVYGNTTQVAPGNVAPSATGYTTHFFDEGSYTTGAYTKTISQFDSGLTYYARAYVRNLWGYAYGDEITFTAATGWPRTDTYAYVAGIDDTSAYLRGLVAHDGSQTITERGFVYGTVSPAFTNYVDSSVSGYQTRTWTTGTYGEGNFAITIANLEPDTLYYYRAFSKNADGYEYGGEFTFRTTREGIRKVDTINPFNKYVTPLGPSFHYFSQAFETRGTRIERIALWFIEASTITGQARILICPDDGTGEADEANPIFTSALFTPAVNLERHYFDVNVDVTDETIYHIVADGSGVTAGSLGVGTTEEYVRADSGAFMHYSADGTSWSVFSDPLDIFVEFSYTPPSVTTNVASSVVATKATLNGDITALGDDSVSERGFVYGTTSLSPGAVAESSALFDTESFETSLGDWVNDASNDSNWLRDSAGTPSANTGPLEGQDGLYYIYVETSSGSSFDLGDQAMIEIDLAGTTKVGNASFYYHQYGADQGSLYFEGYTGGKWEAIWKSTNLNINAWRQVEINHTRFDGYSKVRFRNVAAGDFEGDVALDNITINQITPEQIAPAPAASSYDANFEESGTFTTGIFTREITDLNDATTYYYRAFAKSGAGYVYGAEQTFATPALPSVTLNTAEGQQFLTELPTLEFTGTDAEADPLTYDIVIYGANTTVTADTFVGAGSLLGGNLIEGTQPALGQSFTGDGKVLYSVSFALSRIGSPVGDMTVKLWSHSGTFGTSSVPGTLLATALPQDASTLPAWTTQENRFFTFEADQQMVLANGTNYVITIEFAGTGTDYVVVGRRQDADATHAGNFIWTDDETLTTWNSISTWDNLFEVKTLDTGVIIYKESDTDAGFTNTVNGADTDPFNSGEKIQYSVQASEELAVGTYYYKVRAFDPASGLTDYNWSTQQSFNIEAVTTYSTTKTLAYNIWFSENDTLSLEYQILLSPEISKSLEYTVTDPNSITKSLNYQVIKTYSTTKSIDYSIDLGSTTLNKQLVYEVLTEASVTKSLAYSILTTDSVTKSLHYEAITAGSITKSAKYAVITEELLTKALEYQVLTDSIIEKGLEYQVTTNDSITKSEKYTVLTSISDTLSLEYSLDLSGSDSKSLKYTIETSDVILKSVRYAIDLGSTTQTKSLSYEVLTSDSFTKSLDYYIRVINSATKQLQYIIKDTESLAKSGKYSILTSASQTKGLVYQVLDDNFITKTGKYAVHTTSDATKSLEYYIETIDSIQKSLEYSVIQSIDDTLSLQYEIKSPVSTELALTYSALTNSSEQLSLEYQATAINSITKSISYSIITDSILGLGLEYSVITDEAITRELNYNVDLGSPTLNKLLTYRVITDSSISKQLEYSIQTLDAMNLELGYYIKTIESLTKGLEYQVLTDLQNTKSLTYQILKEVSDAKALQYEVLRDESITKAVQYSIETQSTLTKSLGYTYTVDEATLCTDQIDISFTAVPMLLTKDLTYTIETSDAIEKGLQYAIDLGESAITKQLHYEVLAAVAIVKDLEYYVLTTDSIDKNLAYFIGIEYRPTKSLKYTIHTSPELEKDLRYDVITTDSIVKGIEYYIGRTFSQTKELHYEIESAIAITKSLQYVAVEPTRVILDLIYSIEVDKSITKDLVYGVMIPATIDKELSYSVVRQRRRSPYSRYCPPPYVKDNNPYTELATPYSKTSSIYEERGNPYLSDKPQPDNCDETTPFRRKTPKALTYTITFALPQVTTDEDVTQESSRSGRFHGNTTDIGTSSVLERGFVLSTISKTNPGDVLPALSEYEIVSSETGAFVEGAYSLVISGLTPSTVYYFRAFVRNSSGVDYGDEQSWRTASLQGGGGEI